METERKFENERTIQALVIMAFIVFIILILFIILLMIKGTTSSSNSIQKGSSGATYNYYNFTTVNNYENNYERTLNGRVVYNREREVVHNDKTNIWGNGREELEYSSYSRHFREKDELGSYVEEFNVYVKNEDNVGGYFQVEFYFENCYGDDFVESLTKYITPGETEKFRYVDIWYKQRGICDWDYEVFS